MSNQVWYVTSKGGYVICEGSTAKLPAQAYVSEYYSREDKPQLCVRELQTENKYLFPNSVSHDIVRAITTFWDNAIIYGKMGLRHQRGILLHGAPGMGKTAIAQIVGQQIIEQDGLFLICEDFDDFVDGIEAIRQTEPNRPMVGFIEDVDSYISSNEEAIVAL
ncbi:MAG: AAA family ATPase, partial [Candidatus Omnitrophota bacterium]